MFVIVGLGNPGSQYEDTRHNIGFTLIDKIASESGVFLSQNRFGALTARTSWQGHDVFLMKPQSYMNLSGESVIQALNFFKTPTSHLIVVFDDLDQSSGAVKTRLGGSHGGHNGMRDILDKLKDDKFYRLKIGIGRPEHKSAVTSWVLGKFSSQESEFLEKESFPKALNRLNEIMKQILKKEAK